MHLARVALMLKQIRIIFSLLPLVNNHRSTVLSTVNDIDSSLTNTNDSILTLN